MKFNYIDIPHQWKDEFTKYPHGYTIFEALCKWTKQVDDMVDNVNDWNDYLDNFVDNFEFELKEEVQSTIERWQSEGLLDDIIGSALNTELDNVKTQLSQTKDRMKDVSVNILDYGAKPIGEFPDYDSTQAFKDAVNSGKNIFIPQGSFLITEPIVLPGNIVIEGVRGKSNIVKNNTVALTLETFDINSVFIINGYRVSMKDITIVGENGVVNGVTFFNNSFYLSFENVNIQRCNKPFDDVKSVWMTHFDSVQLSNCNLGFDFTSTKEKTSLFFNNCWVENCGSGYEFNGMKYSSLTSCGADWVRYNREDNPYGNGYGDKATSRGVYDFNLCRGISLNGIGMESCYGNGAIRVRASFVTVNSANIINLISDYVPNYTYYPNAAVGVIVLEDSISHLNINNVFVDGFTNNSIPAGKNKSLFAYNYNVSAYGDIDDIVVNIFNLVSGSAMTKISGSGNHARNVMDYSGLKRKVRVYDYIDMGSKRIYTPIALSNATGSNTLTIPVTPQGNYNIPHLIKISGYDNGSNVPQPNGFNCEIAFSSLTTVNNVSILNSSTGLAATGNGSTVKITLPNTYTNMIVEIEVMSKNVGLIDIDNIALT